MHLSRLQMILFRRMENLRPGDGSVRRVQPLWPFVAFRTLIGGSAHQTRTDSDLSELLVIASDLTGASCLPPAFRRPKTVVKGVLCGYA